MAHVEACAGALPIATAWRRWVAAANEYSRHSERSELGQLNREAEQEHRLEWRPLG